MSDLLGTWSAELYFLVAALMHRLKVKVVQHAPTVTRFQFRKNPLIDLGTMPLSSTSGDVWLRSEICQWFIRGPWVTGEV